MALIDLDRWVINVAAIILIVVMAVVSIIDALSTQFDGSETIILALGGVFGAILTVVGKSGQD